MRLGPILLALLVACARGSSNAPMDGSGDGPGDGAAQGDAAGDALIGGPPAPLLLTEVVLEPSMAELIEIANPTGQAVSLNGYYLSDSGLYFRTPMGPPAVEVTDFVVKFPPGAVIGPRAVVTVAIDLASAYQGAYGVAPTFSVGSGTMLPVAMNGVANLTNAGELVALFYWNGEDDLVRDVDLMLAGAPSSLNTFVNKSGVMLEGPDAGTIPSTYAMDRLTMPEQPSAPPAPRSTKRIALEAGHEVQAVGGNGLTGDDETSEDTAATWDTAFTAPTPGTLPPGLIP